MFGGDKIKDMMVKIVEDNPRLVQRLLKKNMTMELTNVNGVLKIQVKYQGLVVSEGEVELHPENKSK